MGETGSATDGYEKLEQNCGGKHRRKMTDWEIYE
jgi:hypothetical protein